jgi:integrase
MARKIRKGRKQEVLQKGESYDAKKDIYRYTYVDSEQVRRSVYAKNLAKLREKENELLKNILDGMDVYAMGKATVNYVFDRYIDTKTELRSTTKTNYIYMYDRYIRNGFGKRKIAGIKYSDVLIYYKSLMDNKNLQINTLESIHTLLHPTFQMAVRDDIIRNNPSDGVMAELKKKMPKNSGIRHALTYEQEMAFLDFLNEPGNERWKPLLTVMFGTGCRIGEIIGLRWEDIDMEDRLISVNHNLTYYPRHDNSFKSEFRLSLPKTEAGIRTVPMLDKVYEAFLDEKEYQEETGLRCTSNVEGMDGFIFFNRYCALHNPSTINRAIKRLLEDYNTSEVVKAKKQHREPLIVPHFSCHIARHTFCSRLCENETNVKVIQTIMGHKNIQTTLDTYAEVSDLKKRDVFEGLNDSKVL